MNLSTLNPKPRTLGAQVYQVLNEVVVDRGSSSFLTNIECYISGRLITRVQVWGCSMHPLGARSPPCLGRSGFKIGWKRLHPLGGNGLPKRAQQTCLVGRNRRFAIGANKLRICIPDSPGRPLLAAALAGGRGHTRNRQETPCRVLSIITGCTRPCGPQGGRGAGGTLTRPTIPFLAPYPLPPIFPCSCPLPFPCSSPLPCPAIPFLAP